MMIYRVFKRGKFFIFYFLKKKNQLRVGGGSTHIIFYYYYFLIGLRWGHGALGGHEVRKIVVLWCAIEGIWGHGREGDDKDNGVGYARPRKGGAKLDKSKS